MGPEAVGRHLSEMISRRVRGSQGGRISRGGAPGARGKTPQTPLCRRAHATATATAGVLPESRVPAVRDQQQVDPGDPGHARVRGLRRDGALWRRFNLRRGRPFRCRRRRGGRTLRRRPSHLPPPSLSSARSSSLCTCARTSRCSGSTPSRRSRRPGSVGTTRSRRALGCPEGAARPHARARASMTALGVSQSASPRRAPLSSVPRAASIMQDWYYPNKNRQPSRESRLAWQAKQARWFIL